MGRRLTTYEFIERAKEVHKDRYDYSLVEYQGDAEKVTIICPVHGEFEQQPGSHVRLQQGCPTCSHEIVWNRRNNKEVITKIEQVWGKDFFDYSKLKYKSTHDLITLKCLKHDIWFTTQAGSVFNGIGCSACNEEKRQAKHTNKWQSLFINECKKIHNNRYDYSEVEYKNSYTEVTIICPVHGEFEQRPYIHKNAESGCPKCNMSKGERRVQIYLDEHNIEYIEQYKVSINNSYHYFDFYLPNKNMIIEYNGRQHYAPIK